jgi:trehalose 6-phosphate phosphatase
MPDTHNATPNTPPHWQSQQDRLKTWLGVGRTNYRVGIITDMDGTLAPIVPHPDDARPIPESRTALAQLHDVVALVAAVSGRAADDVRSKVDLPQLVYAGNHGLERWENDENLPEGGRVVASPQAQPYIEALQAIKAQVSADGHEGVWVEDKRVTLSIHYRAHANPTQFRADYLPIITRMVEDAGLKLFEGRMIFEVRPPLDIHKGTIFEALISEYKLDAACFIGDDVTDADAFRVARRLREAGACDAIAIGVESEKGDTPTDVLNDADMMTNSVQDVAKFLHWILQNVT